MHQQRLRMHSQTQQVLQIKHCCRLPAAPRSIRRNSRVTVKAEMGSVVDSLVTYGALSISLGATVYAVFYNWPRKPGKPAAPLTHPEDNFTWGVMGAVSCLPLFNSMAWVLGALQSDNPRPYYWAAALYALPLLRNGFDQDWFSWTLLLLGIAHIQALRIAATEPELQARLQQQLKPLALVSTVANTAGKAVGAALGTGSSSTGSSSSSSQQQLGQGDGSNVVSQLFGGKQADESEDKEAMLRQLELEEFDRRLQGSSGQQQQQQQQRQQRQRRD